MVRWESELIPILSGAKSKLKAGHEEAVEVASGYGIADLVFFDFNESVVNERIKQNLNPIEHANLIRILIELDHYSENESINITLLKKTTPFLKDEIITYLVKNHFLVKQQEGDGKPIFKKGVSYRNGLEDVIAIEAKLKDWKRGLYQAYRYRFYADKSYLAIYTKAIATPLKNLDEFKKYNVGLIEVKDSGIKVHFNPKKEKNLDPYTKAVAYERLLGLQKGLFPGDQEVTGLIPV